MNGWRLFGMVSTAALCAAAGPAEMADRSLRIEAGTGQIVMLRSAAASVFAVDPKVAEVRPASPTSLFVFGVAPGRTTIEAVSASGRPITQLDVTVSPGRYAASATQQTIDATLPGQPITVEPTATGIAISGDVATPMDAQRADRIGRSTLATGQTLENRIQVEHAIQVNLRVRIIEMSRTLTRELGVNWQSLASLGGRYGVISATAALPILDSATSMLGGGYNFNTPGGRLDVNTLIDALAQDQLVHVLAEPNLTAMSGETASFLVGGEFPIPVAQFGNTISIDFKQYGVSLAFVPTVLTDGRISLHVRPEVSQLTTQGAIQLGSGNGSIQIPGLQVRRADTTVELGSGESFAIAGLLQDQTTMSADSVPFIGDLPILGTLFRSDSFKRSQTELVILVTPYLVRPVRNASELTEPDSGWHPPNDIERILLLRQKPAATSGSVSQQTPVPGDAGFIVQ